MRVASGQKIPELDVNMEGEEGQAGEKRGMLSPKSEAGESEVSSNAITSPTDTGDVADRAAAMLEGLQGSSGLNKDGSLSVRRRRESADSEREQRRRRRQQARSSEKTEDGALLSPPPPSTIPEEDDDGDGNSERRGSVVSADNDVTTPVTIVHPPSPEQKRSDRELPTPPPEQ